MAKNELRKRKTRKTHIMIMSTNNRLLLSSKMKHTHTQKKTTTKAKQTLKKKKQLYKILRNRSPDINKQLTAFVACWGSSGSWIHAPNKL